MPPTSCTLNAANKSSSDNLWPHDGPELAGGAAQEVLWNTDVGDHHQPQTARQRHRALQGRDSMRCQSVKFPVGYEETISTICT